MFKVEEFNNVLSNQQFIDDYNWVQQSLVRSQIRQGVLFAKDMSKRLDYFVETVLASCIEWNNTEGGDLCRIGAEISDILSKDESIDSFLQKKYRFKASLLYEHAGLPALSQAAIEPGDFTSAIIHFFKRQKDFQKLTSESEEEFIPASQIGNDLLSSLEDFFLQDVQSLLQYEQGVTKNGTFYSDRLVQLSKYFSLEYNASEVNAFSNVLKRRKVLSTVSNVDTDLFDMLKTIRFPVEFWPAQIQALNGGFLNKEFDSYGLASPTGTGKTFLTRLLIIDAVAKNENSKFLYVVPSRALVYEVSQSLSKALDPLGIKVIAVNPQLVTLTDEEEDLFESSDVVVLTPEKADLLVRLGQTTINDITHVIVDEAHHIEADTRGVLLELYLWRLKRLIKGNVRFIFLSAVAPNIDSLTKWIGNSPKSVIVERRATRMRAGVYKILKNSVGKREGWLEYSDGIKIRIVNETVESSNRKGIAQLAEMLHTSGPILVVAKGKKECENLAEEMYNRLVKKGRSVQLSEKELTSDEFNRLDSRLEREMYPSVIMRSLLKYRIAYHHAGLPPRVRVALEDAIRAGLIDYVFATTTLAEGVNFPFSSVIVQALALREPPQAGVPVKYRPITPRTFWNIAGRAGRPGYDKEGQVILFEPTLGLEKIKYVLKSYLNPNLKDIEPVKSALSKSIEELYTSVQAGEFSLDKLSSIELETTVPKNIRGTINLLRVGLVHAKATNIMDSPEEILESSFASQFLSPEVRDFGKNIISVQANLLTDFFKSKGAPSEKIVAEMGLSIDTVERLKNYVLNLEDWMITRMSNLFYGGNLNLEQAQYLIGPVAKNIAELEGEKLGGYLSELVIKWLSGIPLITIKNQLSNSQYLSNNSLEELISVIYSRIQFLLPWGLFAVDSILEEECKIRKINYNNEVRSLSYLTDSGVPSFDAHRLVNVDFERADATRLYRYYQNLGGINTGTDIFGWLINEKKQTLYKVLRGIDNRRIDFDLDALLEKIRSQSNLGQSI